MVTFLLFTMAEPSCVSLPVGDFSLMRNLSSALVPASVTWSWRPSAHLYVAAAHPFSLLISLCNYTPGCVHPFYQPSLSPPRLGIWKSSMPRRFGLLHATLSPPLCLGTIWIFLDNLLNLLSFQILVYQKAEARVLISTGSPQETGWESGASGPRKAEFS